MLFLSPLSPPCIAFTAWNAGDLFRVEDAGLGLFYRAGLPGLYCSCAGPLVFVSWVLLTDKVRASGCGSIWSVAGVAEVYGVVFVASLS